MFSVIIPLYNKADYILRAIDSVLRQTFTDFEIIVINDGSTDGSDKKVMEKPHPKLTLINQSNQGVSVARNTGIFFAKHEFVAFLDGDDFWDPAFLDHLHLIIRATSRAGIIGTAVRHYYSGVTDNFHRPTPDGKRLNYDYYDAISYFQQATKSTLVCASSVAIKKVFFDNNPAFDPKIKFGEDIDVWFRAILYFGSLYYTPTALAYYSQEDQRAATKRHYRMDETLIPKIIQDDYYPLGTTDDQLTLIAFKEFRIKWIYLRLYPLYSMRSNKIPINDLLIKTQHQLLLARGVYHLPFGWLHLLSSSKTFKKLLTKYLEYLYRAIYPSKTKM